MSARPPARDDGFTLTEMLISISILGIISLSITGMIFTLLSSGRQTDVTLSKTQALQVFPTVFAQDVQSLGVRDAAAPDRPLMQSMELNAPPTSGLFPCGAAGDPSAAFRLAWDEHAADGSTTLVVASYIPVPNGTQSDLRRVLCRAGAVTSTRTVARSLAPGWPAASDIACRAGGTPVSCTSATPPSTVAVTLRVQDPRDPAGTPELTSTSTADRRQT